MDAHVKWNAFEDQHRIEKKCDANALEFLAPKRVNCCPILLYNNIKNYVSKQKKHENVLIYVWYTGTVCDNSNCMGKGKLFVLNQSLPEIN